MTHTCSCHESCSCLRLRLLGTGTSQKLDLTSVPHSHPGLDYLDVVLLAETGPTLQRLIDGMYCNSIGLTINVAKSTKAEIVFPLHGSSVQGSWSVGDQVLPCAESFKYPR